MICPKCRGYEIEKAHCERCNKTGYIDNVVYISGRQNKKEQQEKAELYKAIIASVKHLI